MPTEKSKTFVDNYMWVKMKGPVFLRFTTAYFRWVLEYDREFIERIAILEQVTTEVLVQEDEPGCLFDI